MSDGADIGAAAREIEALFTRGDGEGGFRFARWGRPFAPAVFGTDDDGIRLIEDALRALAPLTGLPLADTDPELGANFLVFFVNDWDELTATPTLDKLIPDVARLVSVLKGAGANQYRIFGFEPGADGAPGAIRICVTLLRYDADLQAVTPPALALTQVAQALLLWSDQAFRAQSPIALVELEDGPLRAALRPEIADVLRAAYDPAIPPASREPALALRLAARVALAREALRDA